MTSNPIILTTKPDMSKVPGGWEPNLYNVSIENRGGKEPEIEYPVKGAVLIKGILTPYACQRLRDLFKHAPNQEAVSVQGNKDHLDSRVGSNRTTMWSPELADGFWEILSNSLGQNTLVATDETLTDWWQGDKNRRVWEAVAVSPMLRFMRYDKGGQHYAHYDAGFIYPDDNYRSLKSIVIYLTTNKTGATRFVDDGQKGPIWDRNHDDWIKETDEEEILFRSYPEEGTILLFDHRMCHDVEQFMGDEEERIIIRGDIIYKSI